MGKTTTAVNVAACLAVADQNVLLLDIDPQGNATTGLGLTKHTEDTENIYNALMDGKITPSMICDTAVDRLKIIPSSPDLYGAEIELVTYEKRESRLKMLIEQISDDFDFVLIDCPPSLGLLTLNALTAANSVLAPIQTEYYALEGLSQLIRTISRIRDSFNPGLKIEGLLFTMVDGRTTLSTQVMQEVKDHFGDEVFNTVIPRNIRLSEAPSHGKPIILYDFKSKGADAYVELATEIIGRNKEWLKAKRAEAAAAKEAERELIEEQDLSAPTV